MNKTIHILGISGSLRQSSSNTNILRSVSGLLPEHVTLELYENLEKMPPFNPGEEENEVVKEFKKVIADSNGIIICTPEYAFGVPGVLKNALDWTVSTGEFNEKPVAAISASPLNGGGDKALASLLLTLKALGTKMNEQSSLSIPNINLKLSREGKLNDSDAADQLRDLVENLLKIIDFPK